MYGVMYIGALLRLCAFSRQAYYAWLAKLKNVAGTSAGALMGFMVVAGMDPWQMRRMVHRCGLERLLRGMLDRTLEDIQAERALTSGEAMDAACGEMVAAATGRCDTTFAELHARTGRTFTVAVTNGSSNSTEYWSHLTRPDMRVAVALRCTTSVPLVFRAPVVDNVVYFDGGLTCNVPCHLFPPESTVTLLVHSPPRAIEPNTGIRATVLRLLSLASAAAQLGVMRAEPRYAARAVPCVAPPAEATPSMAILGPYAFNAAPHDIDTLILQGARCVEGVILRDTLIATSFLTLVMARARARASASTAVPALLQHPPPQNLLASAAVQTVADDRANALREALAEVRS